MEWNFLNGLRTVYLNYVPYTLFFLGSTHHISSWDAASRAQTGHVPYLDALLGMNMSSEAFLSKCRIWKD